MASGTNPGTTYTITMGDPGVYHEDRVLVTEVALSTYVTQMFRVYGATFSGSAWNFQSGVSAAYATVQNPDGSIHYFTYSGADGWLTSAWQGSDNNTVYNAVDFGATGGGSASDNTTALSSLFAAMVAPAGLPGGTAWIPQYNYPVNASLVGLTVPIQSIFQGLGTGGHGRAGTNVHFLINDTTSAGTFLSCSGVHTSGGTFFKNLAFQWSDPEFAGDTVLFLQYQGNAVEDCTFLDCPTALYIRGLTTLVKHCEIYYNVLASDPGSFQFE